MVQLDSMRLERANNLTFTHTEPLIYTVCVCVWDGSVMTKRDKETESFCLWTIKSSDRM